MRSPHEPVTDPDRLISAFGVTPPEAVERPDRSTDLQAPFIVQAARPCAQALGDLHVGVFGLLPASAPDTGLASQTQRCGVETMKSHPTFRESWWAGRRCIVPVEALFEWGAGPGQTGLWRIGRADGQPMGLAGLWSAWTSPDGESLLSFCVLTLKGDGHAVFERLSHPMREKRMPVILAADSQRQWLNGTSAQAQQLLVPLPAEQLHACLLEPASGSGGRHGLGEADLFADDDGWAAPMAQPARKRRSVVRRPTPSAPVPITGDLFG